MVKKTVTILVIAFLAYYLITQPTSAANFVQGVGSALSNAFRSVITFFSALTS